MGGIIIIKNLSGEMNKISGKVGFLENKEFDSVSLSWRDQVNIQIFSRGFQFKIQEEAHLRDANLGGTGK